MSVVHTHSAIPVWFIFKYWCQVAIGAYKYTRICLQCLEIKEAEEFQKWVLKLCSVTYMFFVLLVKKIILDKE